VWLAQALFFVGGMGYRLLPLLRSLTLWWNHHLLMTGDHVDGYYTISAF
jgi:hypothetical protein